LTNWGEKDPIVEFTKQLRKSSDKEDWQLAKKIEPKIRYFAPVIVRGEEDKGARLWEFGKLTYEQLLGIASDEDYGDYTDISEGRDFTIDAVEDTVANRKVVKCNLRVKPKTTPISEDGALVEKLLEEQPDILAINKRYVFEDLQEVLNKWLNPEETAEESETPVASATAEDEETTVGNAPWEKEETKPTPAYSLKTDAAKKSHADEFDSLFDE
jgi:CheY-like chemotaxis protein